MAVLRSAKRLAERLGLRPTLRLPSPRMTLGDTRLTDYPVKPPFPLPDLLLASQGDPPPDRPGPTTPWPYGVNDP